MLKEYKETHQYGIISIENKDIILDKNYLEGDIRLQIAKDGRIWICINGIAFLRFKPINLDLKIVDLYSQGFSLREIGKKLNISYEWARLKLKKNKIEREHISIGSFYTKYKIAPHIIKSIVNKYQISPNIGKYFSKEQEKEILQLYNYSITCSYCGGIKSSRSQYCYNCWNHHRYKLISNEAKEIHNKRCKQWQLANPERYKEIQRKAVRKYWDKKAFKNENNCS